MQRRIIIVIGPSGSGKTRTVSELIQTQDRVAVFDMVKDTQYFQSNGKPTPGVVVIEGQPKQFGREIGLIVPLVPKEDTQHFKVIYHPVKYRVEKNGLCYSDEFGWIVQACYDRGDMWLVIDEAHLWCDSYNCPPELMNANLIGRHKELSMILVAQRFTGINPAIRENADEFYFWKVIQPASLKSIADYCGDDVAEQVGNLRAVELDEHNKFKAPGQRLHWTKFKGVVEVTE